MVKRTNRTTSAHKTKKTSSSKSHSATARKQRRHRDGTFSGGFKKKVTPKRTTSKNNKTTIKSNTKSKQTKTSTRSRNHSNKTKYVESILTFDCPSSTKEKVIKTVSENFSKEETDKIDKLGKPVITTKQTSRPTANGGYDAVTTEDKNRVPIIHLSPNASESTITHEFIHHMRGMDEKRDKFAKTAYPVDSKGKRKIKTAFRNNLKNIANSEESATCAETEIRTKHPSEKISRYWNFDKHSISGKPIRDHDRTIVRNDVKDSIKEGENAIGDKAINLLNSNYPKTQISSRSVGGTTALNYFRKIIDLRKKGKW